MEELAIQIITLVTFFAFAAKRLMNYLQALQQDDYHNGRLFRWMLQHKVFDSRVSQALVILIGAILFTPLPLQWLHIIIFFVFIIAAYFERDPRSKSKKPLVMTKRANRIFMIGLTYALCVGTIATFISTPHGWVQILLWIAAIQSIPFLLILGNVTLAPYETSVQSGFVKEAQEKLKELKPTIIAITGSYGKTSIKHILAHILKSNAPTLVTPGSVNTVMGVTRIIREQLQPNHRYFVTEMGAYGPGSVGRLCKLTPPDVGIISAIGHAHYERFKSLENVVEAKYELAEAVLEKNGTVIVHEKTLKWEYSRKIRNNAMDNFIVCGEPMNTDRPKSEQEFSYLGPDDVNILSVQQTPKGVCVEIRWKDEKYTLRAPLYGIHHGHNMVLAFACAVSMGVDPKQAKTALASTPQIKHRLEVNQQADGTIVIDDAFNSNPPGFRSALHVMNVLANDSGGRSILITPGIVELGTAHDEVHATLGAFAAEICDIVIVIQPNRIRTFVDGFHKNNTGKLLIEYETFAQAQEWLIKNRKGGDVILLENDLPDIYERVLKI
ncbi:MAG: UDP-N-acetylmuramoyl-tripeptide--D-alanyl-D-alanine ligase [Alphaproteobacteria bacterium]|nr:UDP-N-acetylmuramoyl-tripeptide--D-alanyl-D-alanine ligase [Alphaproteobacteria bacterium]